MNTLISSVSLSAVLFFTACKRSESIKASADQSKVETTHEVDGVEPASSNNVEIVDFEGFINYGSPIEVPEGLGTPVELVVTESRIEMPVFTAEQLEEYGKKNRQKPKQAAHTNPLPRLESKL